MAATVAQRLWLNWQSGIIPFYCQPPTTRPDNRPHMPLTLASIHTALTRIVEPVSGAPLSELVVDVRLQSGGGAHHIELRLGIPVYRLREWISRQLAAALADVADGKLEVECVSEIPAPASEQLPGVANLIAVASGKGGVGKSSTAVNLALALRAEGARVGLMDADIYGPSVPRMLGIEPGTRPRVIGENRFAPIEQYGLQTLSMGNLMTEQTPAVWRGPMASGAFQQILTQTLWHELDYLVVDMPPGTGDIQLTLAQRAPVSGAVIVTTPQDIALADAIRGIEMFRKVDIPVLGVIENMAVHVCSNCGHREHLFGSGGAARLAGEYDAPQLASLPLDIRIRQALDEGRPTLVDDPDGDLAQPYLEAARRLAVRLYRLRDENRGPEIEIDS